MKSKGTGGLTANEFIQARDEFLVLHYSGRNEDVVYGYSDRDVVVTDESNLVLNTPTTIRRVDMEASAQSVIAPGTSTSGKNDVVMGVLEIDALATGKYKLKTPLATFHHDTGEAQPAIVKPMIASLGTKWIVPLDGSANVLGFQYIGDNDTKSEYLKITASAKQEKLTKINGGVTLTPNLAAGGGVGLAVTTHREGALMKNVTHRTGIQSSIGSNSTWGSIRTTEDWWLISRIDPDQMEYVAGTIAQRSTFSLIAKGRIVIKGAGDDRTIENFMTHVKECAVDFANDIATNGGGIKFKPKFTIENQDYINYPDDVNWSIRENYGWYEIAYDSMYPDRRRDEVIENVDVQYVRDFDFVKEVRIDELWVAVNGVPIQRLGADEDGYYIIANLDEAETFPYDDANATKIRTSTYQEIEVTSGHVLARRGSEYFKHLTYNSTTLDWDGAAYAVTSTLADIPSDPGALLVPVLEFTNINPTVRDVMMVSRGADGAKQRTSIGTSPTYDYNSVKLASDSEYQTYADGVVSDLPELPLANRRNVDMTWHLAEDEIRLFPGEILGMVPQDLPYSALDASHYCRFVTVHLPYELDK